MPTVTEIFETMDYGPAPESDAEARAWLAGHRATFGHFIGGAWTKPGTTFDVTDPSTNARLARVTQGTAKDVDAAVAAARKEGIDASGPWPADSVFNRAIAGEFDVVLALYHDQGHIAIKVHDFHGSTTATLGLSFVRTSVDHGTAFDIAGKPGPDGKGLADPASLLAAIEQAHALSQGAA